MTNDDKDNWIEEAEPVSDDDWKNYAGPLAKFSAGVWQGFTFTEKRNITATDVMTLERKQALIRQRFENELFGPLLDRVIALAGAKGLLPDPEITLSVPREHHPVTEDVSIWLDEAASITNDHFEDLAKYAASIYRLPDFEKIDFWKFIKKPVLNIYKLKQQSTVFPGPTFKPEDDQ